MLKRLRLTNVLCAAIGACLGFYFLASLVLVAIITILIIALTVMCFFRVLASIEPNPRRFRLMTVYSTVFAVGLFLGVCAQIASVNNVKFGIPESNITALNGILLEDPRLITSTGRHDTRAMAAMSLRQTAGSGGLRVSGSGEITVVFPEDNALKIREFGRGTTIFTEGRLNSVQRRSSETAWTFYAQSAHVVKPASAIERMRTGIRLNLIERFDGKNWGGLALAMLVGIRDNLDSSFTASYRSAGLSYILALSGMHLAVITALISFLLKKPLGLKAAAIIGAVIICLYCFIVGAMPGLNRAALMYLLGVLAILGALPKKSLSVLALSFLIQIIITPSAGNSISFILSYLAMLGILVIGKSLVSLFSGKVPDFLLQPLAVSCGAFLATAGVVYAIFGELVPSGIIASLLIVPATTLFMVGSILWLVLDMFSVSGILNVPLSLLYQFMEKTALISGKIPGIASSKPFVIIAASIFLSLFIIVIEYRLRKTRLKLQPFYD